ncbi:MAG: hypothetical protein QOF40_2716 [Actinomycetota bacterium]|nr:hypothetical protein [Actinomycetota bacterium]
MQNSSPAESSVDDTAHLLNWSSMRKQYHSQPGAAGLDAWDVDRLVDLSRDLPVREVPLDSFWQVDTVYWAEPFTVRTFTEHVRLVQAVDPSHPIILAADGRVMDGMHRIVRAFLAGDTAITAVQFDVTPEPDHRDCRLEDLPYPDDAD